MLIQSVKAPKPSPHQGWTLRFKRHKTTTLLLVQATQSFPSIKEDLLTAIKATGRADIDGTTLPSDADDIIFGVPVDKNDPGQGWVELEMQLENGGNKNGKSNSVFNENPMGAGLKDGSLLTFKFDPAEEWDAIMPSYDEDEAD